VSPRAKANLLRSLLCCWLAIFAFSGAANASWWNAEWALRRKITLDTTSAGANVSDPIGGAVVLLRLHDGNFSFDGAKDDGSDLRFVAEDDKTLLTYHIERYDTAVAEAFVWVKIPDLKPGAKTSIWMYYGNAGPHATKVEDAKGTYDSDAVLVYHFSDKNVPPVDSTGQANNAQNAGLIAQSSWIAGGVRFDGHKTIQLPASGSLAWTGGATVTWSAWIKLTTLSANAVIFSRREGANAFVIGSDNGVPYAEVTDASGTHRTTSISAFQVGAWHHVAVTASKPKITIYLDGEPSASVDTGLPDLSSAGVLGGEAGAPADAAAAATAADASESAGFVGELDELEISKSIRSPAWIKLAAFGQSSDGGNKFINIGPDEQPSTWLSWLSTGYFGVIIKSLTLDGWVVICILAVMAVMSWGVMVNKISYLNGISKGNALFMKEWSRVAADLTVLDDDEEEPLKKMGGGTDKAAQRAMRSSSVYRIYHIGSEEIRHRIVADKNSGSRKGLSGRSIQAIRASLDGGLVRETQKINRLIVLLTICISGGPFLGLLGTVVGVMITFAAVAAAGEVNVNAIAPGIAAALLATVAGLAVAIPSLFGYNYILSRVKDATADMHVFIDEFVTKMAEFYRERPEPQQQFVPREISHANSGR
jgi:biopolymer transport protein ExbB